MNAMETQTIKTEVGLNAGSENGGFGLLAMIQRFAVTNINSLFASSILIAAFLIFQVQPMIGKVILPWFGGGPSVWTNCLVFFQLALLGGYSYAFLLSRFLPISKQLILHMILIATSLLVLPILPGSEWQPEDSSSPGFRISWLLAANIGIPYLLLSATSPLFQHWYSKTSSQEIPYRLYALSNLGSLAALLSYPLLFEPFLSVDVQSYLWSAGFVAFATCAGVLMLGIWAQGHVSDKPLQTTIAATAIHWKALVSWVLLSAFGSMALVAITNEICQELTVGPMLWILPLCGYLISFIIGFEKPSWYQPRWIGLATIFVLIPVFAIRCEAWTLLDDIFESVGFEADEFYSNMFVEAGLYVSSMFLFCLICHGELYRKRPVNTHLTAFYLAIALGGAIGGLFVSLVCPNIFQSFFETEIVFSTAAVLAILVFSIDGSNRWLIPKASVGFLAGIFSTVILYFVLSHSFSSEDSDALIRIRNFYGILAVDSEFSSEHGRARSMYHGRTIHGFQYVSDEMKSKPTTYYNHTSGVGLALLEKGKHSSLQVGVVGLGTGTLSAYGRSSDKFDFYEINPAVASLAMNAFSYIRNSQADVSVIEGDARILLKNANDDCYDVLVLDAFSGDGIPTHLLTKEAFELFDKKILADGVIAAHLSNRYLDLVPIVARIAHEGLFQMALIETDEGDAADSAGSCWVLLSRDKEFMNAASIGGYSVNPQNHMRPGIGWTDSFNSLLGLFK